MISLFDMFFFSKTYRSIVMHHHCWVLLYCFCCCCYISHRKFSFYCTKSLHERKTHNYSKNYPKMLCKKETTWNACSIQRDLELKTNSKYTVLWLDVKRYFIEVHLKKKNLVAPCCVGQTPNEIYLLLH